MWLWARLHIGPRVREKSIRRMAFSLHQQSHAVGPVDGPPAWSAPISAEYNEWQEMESPSNSEKRNPRTPSEASSQ